MSSLLISIYNIMHFFILFFLITSVVHARCMRPKKSELIKQSKLILAAKVTHSSLISYKELTAACKKNNLQPITIKYTVSPIKISPSVPNTKNSYTIVFPYYCGRCVGSPFLQTNHIYHFLVQKIEQNTLKLLGYTCSRWGWED